MISDGIMYDARPVHPSNLQFTALSQAINDERISSLLIEKFVFSQFVIFFIRSIFSWKRKFLLEYFVRSDIVDRLKSR